MTIGERIRNRREELQIPQTKLADDVNISKQTLYKYESNIVTNIPLEKIAELAQALSVSPAYLMGWDEPEVYHVSLDNLGILEVNADALEMGKTIASYIEKFYSLSENHQEQILEVIDMFAEKDGEADGKI